MREGDTGKYGGKENTDFLKDIEGKFTQAETENLNAVNLDEAIPPAGLEEAQEYATKLFNAANSSERRVAIIVWAYKGIDSWSSMDLGDGLRHFCLWALPQLTEEETQLIDEYNAAEKKRFNEMLQNPDIFEQPDEGSEDKDK